MIAAHQTMLAPQGAPLGSVAFSGASGSNLFYQNASQPTVYTMSCWAKSASSSTHGCYVKVGVKDGEYGSDVRGSGVGFGVGGSSFGNDGSNMIVLREGVAYEVSGAIPGASSWHHYAVSVNGRSVYAYIDGALVKSSSNTVYTFATCYTYFGGYASGSNRWWAGEMTRCAMWNRVLSASEIATDYADGKNAPTTTNGLDHFWPMSSADNYLADAVGSATLTAGTGGVTISTDTPFA